MGVADITYCGLLRADVMGTAASRCADLNGQLLPCRVSTEGPIVLMIENYRTGLLWRWMRNCPYIASGLRRAGFVGGWL